MDYCDQIESQRASTPSIIKWSDIPVEKVSDPRVSTHSSSTRQTWIGKNTVLTKAVVGPKSSGRMHSHESEQVSMILRGSVRVHMQDKVFIAEAGSIVHIPSNAVHMFEMLDEEVEIFDIYPINKSAEEMRKHYPT
jgi:quercetin dioxygenase-like cupin family protein